MDELIKLLTFEGDLFLILLAVVKEGGESFRDVFVGQ